jgi:hypothetical protein
MTDAATLSPERAGRLVEARLGRAPQDMLEAAVVLEAWAGVPAARALDAGRSLMAAQAPAPLPARSAAALPPPPPLRDDFDAEAASFVLAVLAIACWAAPLADGLGTSVLRTGILVALPVTLALQWGLRSRYLGRPHGLVQLGRHGAALALLDVALVGGLSAALGLGGAVAALLTVTWTAGTVLICRRWSVVYAAGVIGAAGLMLAGLPALPVLGVTAALAALAVAAALRGPVPDVLLPAGRARRALAATAIGASLGVLLVADPTIDWTVGAVPALALLPSTVGSFWGGYHLWGFQQAILRSLSGVPVAGPGSRNAAWPALRVLLGAGGRLVVGTVALSGLLLLAGAALDMPTSGVSVLAGFGLIALATLVVSLLESVGRVGWAMLAVAAAVAGELLVGSLAVSPFPAAGLLAGAVLALVIALPAAVALLGTPARTLATSLWIA